MKKTTKRKKGFRRPAGMFSWSELPVAWESIAPELCEWMLATVRAELSTDLAEHAVAVMRAVVASDLTDATNFAAFVHERTSRRLAVVVESGTDPYLALRLAALGHEEPVRFVDAGTSHARLVRCVASVLGLEIPSSYDLEGVDELAGEDLPDEEWESASESANRLSHAARGLDELPAVIWAAPINRDQWPSGLGKGEHAWMFLSDLVELGASRCEDRWPGTLLLYLPEPLLERFAESLRDADDELAVVGIDRTIHSATAEPMVEGVAVEVDIRDWDPEADREGE